MYKKGLITLLFIVSLIFAGSITVSAQTFIARGKVELRGADGTLTPVQGAIVEGFRIDTNGKSQPATTNKRGEYSLAGLQAGGQYVLSASAPGAAPKILNGIRSNVAQNDFNFTLEAGDGRRYTQAEAMEMAKGGGSGSGASTTVGGGEVKETEDQKKAREEYAKKVAEVQARNAKVQNADKVIATAQKEGIDAYKAKNYDLAIAKFDEGIAADPEYTDAVVIFNNMKSEAYRNRGFDKHVSWTKADDASKPALRAAAKEDMGKAFDIAKGNYETLSKIPTPADPKAAQNIEANKYNALANITAALYMFSVNEVDMGRGEDIKNFYPMFLAAEKDPLKKEVEQREFADALRKSGECEAAVTEYQKILDVKATNIDALAGKGLCMINNGYMTGKKEELQEGLNVLQQFVELAPEDHKLKASAKITIEGLKQAEQLTPQKTKPAPKKKP